MKRTVLYFDDDPLVLDTFREMFGAEYDVLTAQRLAEARRALADSCPDIIISDQLMPEVSGVEFLREVARLCPGSYRVLATGAARVGDVFRDVSAGVIHSFVPKPWTEEVMRQVLGYALVALDLPARPEAERRSAPRFKVRLETRVLMLAVRDADAGDKGLLTLSGYTYDVSESGVALVVSDEDMKELSAFGHDYTLELVLTLPQGPVGLTVAPVRHQRHGGSEHLIGARITDMSGRDRVLYMSYVRGLADAGAA